MKKISIFILSLFFAVGLKAQQTTLTEAVDFTVTDCHGQTYNLFEILDRGQAVFIDFFFYTCGQCQTISPYITGSYTQMGCNMHDVFYIEISYIDSDATCQQWANQYGVEFPTVGRDGGGNEVFELYGIQACPTLVLIMPDRSIPIQGLLDLYPFSAQDVVNAMQQNGLQPHDCTGTLTVNPQTLHIYNSCYSAPSWSQNTWYGLTVGSTTYAFKTPSSGGTPLVISGGSSPTLQSNVNVAGGTECFEGMFYIDASVSGGNSVSLSSYTGGNGGGGGPGGGGHGPF